MTPKTIVNMLEELKALQSVASYEAVWPLQDKLEEIFQELQKDPALLSDPCLASLEKIAQNSPHHDIHDPQGELHHKQSPAQDICLYTTSLFVRLAFAFPGKSETIIQCLEQLAQTSLDFNIRKEAVMSLWVLSQHEQQQPYAVAALEQQGAQNSDASIRMLARENLLGTSQNDEKVVSRAVAAQVKGSQDDDPEARTRAIALLTNRVKSPTCPEEEVRNLLLVFEDAAARAAASDKQVLHWANTGIAESQKRLKDGITGFKFP